MIESTSLRAWTCIGSVLSRCGGAAAANLRLAASSVGPIGSTIGPPCVLATLGSRRPGHHEDVKPTIKSGQRADVGDQLVHLGVRQDAAPVRHAHDRGLPEDAARDDNV